MSRLARELDAVNLGQGFPDTHGPSRAIEAAVRALRAGSNQYAPPGGVEPLRRQVASLWGARFGRTLDPDRNVTITSGATEAIAAACLAWLDPGDEAVVLEPAYDAYLAAIRAAGARPVGVDLGTLLEGDRAALEAAVTPRTRLIVVNSPHNPSGAILGTAALNTIADVATRSDLRVLSDEVYEFLVYDGEHRSLGSVPGMWERTLVVSSAAKTFGLTGWKVGWALGPEQLVREVRSQVQYLTYAGATPLQLAVADALDDIDALAPLVREPLRRQRELLVRGLEDLGFHVVPSQAGYFVLSDFGLLRAETSHEAALALAHTAGVVTIPVEPFYADPARAPKLIRWSFARQPDVLSEALRRLRTALLDGPIESQGTGALR